jgi:uncharacterized Zn finger protein
VTVVSPRWSSFPRYVTVAERRERAEAAAARLGSGRAGLEPVAVSGRRMVTTFWGKAWCENLESYSDLASRLPRGRSYLRSGAVVDLKIAAGQVRARVAGTRLYEATVTIRPLPSPAWRSLVAECAGRVDSLVALLEGRMPDQVMHVVTHPERGLFPRPRQITMTCSCPDGAVMCKHLAATLYGVGARLDQRPELLFVLRRIDAADLVPAAVGALVADETPALGGQSLEDLFGIDLAPARTPAHDRPRRKRR